MGKKISPASLMKISKNHHHEKKQQPNSLLKVLRPKVYITHPSRFKSLVQQLTGLEGGNSTAIDISSSSPPPQTPQLDQNNISIDIINIDQDDHGPEHHQLPHDHDHDHVPDESNSMELATSSDYASVDSFEHIPSCNQLPGSLTEEVDQLAYDQMYQLDHDVISEYLWMNDQQQQQKEGFWDNQDMESWPLDMYMEPCADISYNGCYSQIQQEVSIYDYELPGLI